MLTAEALAGSYAAAGKPPSAWGIGIELEKIGVDAASSRPVPYDGSPVSILAVLETFARARPSVLDYEGDRLIALEGAWGTITLEPGGQVEWSSHPDMTLTALATRLAAHLDLLDRAGEAIGIRWLQTALQPDTPLSEMPWMPKERYRIMREYFRSRGRLAHRMMTQTASVQVSLDYDDEEDWREKFRAAFLLAPVVVALFANSSQLEGRDTGYASFRAHIWRDTDDDRCGAPAFVFRETFGFRDWVEYLLDVPAMFVQRQGRLVPADGASWRTFLADGIDGHPVTLDDWRLHASGVFTESRTKSYIELRSADLTRSEHLMAVPAFYTGLLYDRAALEEALGRIGWGRGKRPSPDGWTAAMEEAARAGTGGRLNGRPLSDLAGGLCDLARTALGRREPAAVRFLDGVPAAT